MREVREGVWHWEAPHPEWKPGEEWGPAVSSYAIDTDGGVVLFDPLTLPAEIEGLAADRETVIVLTCPWHRRDAVGLAQRLGAQLHVPAPEEGGGDPMPGQVFRAGDPLPLGVEALEGHDPSDVLLFVESRGALVAGDSLIDRGNGLEIPADWVGTSLEQVRETLRGLVGGVDVVLPTHGAPSDRSALERALA